MVACFNTWILPLLAVSIDCLCNVQAQRCKESEVFDSGQIASDDLSARMHAHTDNCKISIMIIRSIRGMAFGHLLLKEFIMRRFTVYERRKAGGGKESKQFSAQFIF